jgi:cell division protein FtsQ
MTLIGILFLAFALFAGYGGNALANSAFFDLREIRFEGSQALTRDELLALSGLRIGANLLRISKDEVTERILAHPYIKTVEARRILPDKILIAVTERQPAALISYGQRHLALDDEGSCLAELDLAAAESWAMPRIRCGPAAIQLLPGEKTEDEGVLAAITLVGRLDPFFLENILEIDAPSAWELTVIHLDGLPVHFGPPENLPQKLQYYEDLLIKNKDECNANLLEYVDLRYDTQPIIKRK